MKLILTKNVQNLGKMGEIVTVKTGYGINYLIPQGLAEIATPELEVIFQKKQAKAVKAAEAKAKALADAMKKLTEVTLKIREKMGEKEEFYGSITAKTIAEKLSEATKSKFTADHIKMDKTIVKPGRYEVEVKVTPEMVGKVKVVAEAA